MIKLTLQGNLLFIEPADELRALHSELSYTHKSMERNSMNFDYRKLFYIEEGRLITAGGFLKRVTRWLKERRIEYTVADNRNFKKPEPLYERLGELRDGQPEAIACISLLDGGIIVAATAFGKTNIIVEVAKMYPTLRIAIVSNAVQVINTVYDRLMTEIGISQLGRLGGKKGNSIGRITVSTVMSLKKLDPSKVDLLLFDECHRAGAPETAAILAAYNKARFFGFTASPTGRTDGADLVVEGMFGEVVFNRPYQEAVAKENVVPIEAHIYKIEGNIKFETPMERKRKGFWRHRRRNDYIAAVANAVEYKDLQILILVDTTEHLLHLSKLLPDFAVAYSDMTAAKQAKFQAQQLIDDDFKILKKDELNDIRRKFGSREIMKVIATGVFNEGVDFPSLDVCIRAAGGSSEIKSIQLPGRVARLHDGKDVGILIDFMDSFSPETRKASMTRIKKYRTMGWKIVNHYT